MEVVCQEKTHKIWERSPNTFERRSGYKLGKEGVLEAEKGFSNDYQIQIMHNWRKSWVVDYRKESSFFPNLVVQKVHLRLSPTKCKV